MPIKKEKILAIIDKSMEIAIIAVIFFLPIYFSFLYNDNSIYNLSKAALFRIITELLVILLVARLFIAKKLQVYIGKKHLILIALFFLAYIFATIASLDPYKSFWGSYFRQQGLFTYLHYFFFFIALAATINEKNKIEKLISAAILSSYIVSLLGVMQWMGMDYLPLIDRYAAEPLLFSRVISTFGQPVFLGNFLVLTIFLTIYRIFSSNKLFWKFIYSYVLLFQFFCLIFTYTRGAWIGFILGVLTLLGLWLYIKINSLKKYLIAFSAIFLAVSFMVFVFVKMPRQEAYGLNIVSRIESIVNPQFGSFAMRIKIMNAALDLFQKKPIMGYGPEMQEKLFIEYYDPSWSILESINTFSDRAHNEILDIALNGGLILLSAYLLILFFALRGSILLLKQDGYKHKNLLLFLLASVIAYQVSLLSSFSITATSVYYWIFISLIFLMINRFDENSIIKLSKETRYKNYAIMIFGILLQAIAAYAVMINVNSLKADYFFLKARTDFSVKNYTGMHANYLKVFERDKHETYYETMYLSDMIDTLPSIDGEEYREQVLNYIEENFKIKDNAGGDYYELQKAAKIYETYGLYKDKEYFKKSEKIYSEMARSYPFIADIYKNWGKSELARGELKKADRIFDLSLSVLPGKDFKEYENIGYILHKKELENYRIGIYLFKAIIYYQAKQYGDAIKYYKMVLALNPHLINVYKNIADCYYLDKDIDMAIKYNKRALALNPADSKWYYNLSQLYKEINDHKSSDYYKEMADKLSIQVN